MTEGTTPPLPQPDAGLPVSGHLEEPQTGQAPFAVGGGREGAAPAGAEPPVPDWVGDFINRRTDIENELRAMAAGKLPLPTAEDCRRMADTLSIPSNFLRPYPPLAARPEPKEWR